MPDDRPQLLTARQVCDLLHISKTTCNEWRDQGLLTAHQLPNGQWRYPSTQPAVQDAQRALGVPA